MSIAVELKTNRRPVNFDEIVLKALFERMDPETRTVAPQWRSLASSLGVCRMTLGKYIHQLKEEGRIETVTSEEPDGQSVERPQDGHPSPTWLPNSRKRYFINESVDADWAASVEPQFRHIHAAAGKRRPKTTKAELDAAADARMAERCRLVMEDFLARMDPKTHAVAPRTKDMASRIGRRLNSAEYLRVVRAFKAAGLVEARRMHGAQCGNSGNYVFILDTEAIAGLDYLRLAQTYRLKTIHAEKRAKATPSPAKESEVAQPSVAGAVEPEVVQAPPPRPAAVQKPAGTFTGLSLENFKNSGSREVPFDRISAVDGKSGADRTQVFDAMRVLRGIAQGGDASSFPALWFGSDWPATLSITLNTLRHGMLTYSVTLQRMDDRRVRVADERLAGRFETLLVRRRHFYTHLATRERRGIGTSSFALCDAGRFLDADDPVAQFRRQLGNLWLLNPDPNAMKSEIGFGVANGGAGDFSDFATCMAVQQKQAGVAAALRSSVFRLCPGLVGYSVEPNANGVPQLVVRHRSDLDGKGTPFALLDNAEKILFLVSFVCAMNECSSPAPVVWLSPFNWLGERERVDAVRLIRETFANRGQMIMLP